MTIKSVRRIDQERIRRRDFEKWRRRYEDMPWWIGVSGIALMVVLGVARCLAP